MKIKCPHCDFVQFGNRSVEGKTIRCRKCKETFVVNMSTLLDVNNECALSSEENLSPKLRTSMHSASLDALKTNKFFQWFKTSLFFLVIFLVSCLMVPIGFVVKFYIYLPIEYFAIRKIIRPILRVFSRIAYWFVVIVLPLLFVTTNSSEKGNIQEKTETKKIKQKPRSY